jgi:hypothetical protein
MPAHHELAVRRFVPLVRANEPAVYVRGIRVRTSDEQMAA